ncbi:MAG: AAA family ATPase [Candidatus Dadabacteria bacterium]|nr:AAA family ATPase [Candidatus Dadabacteria bacterium]
MRIRRLDLIGFGCFTGKAIDLPHGDTDIHILFGPNEAGKSTALLAIENLLFGIDKSSPYNFIHDYKDMRIGAVLENGSERLEVRRRKGNKDTLLTPKEVPVRGGEGALAPYLGGADEEFFRRMFSLDHRRLREGGREILDSQDEAGQVLFSAGTGLSGLRKKLEELKADADSLWGPRRAAHREYYKAQARLEEAERAVREHTVTAARWEELRQAYDEARKSYAGLDEERKKISHELTKLNRIRRVYADAAKLLDTEREITNFRGIIKLPEDALERFDKAERELEKSSRLTEAFELQVKEAGAELEGMKFDEQLLLCENIILSFRDRRIEVRNEKDDLPKREEELAIEEADFRRLAGEAGWDGGNVEELINRLPARSKINAARELRQHHVETLATVSGAKKALEEAESQAAGIAREMTGIGEPRDASSLEAVVKAARAGGDTASRIQAAELELSAASGAVERRLKSLNPPTGDADVSTIPAPPREAVLKHQNDRNALDRRIKECADNLRSTERDIGQYKSARDRLAGEGNAVSPGELAEARARRDAGWELVKRYYVDGGPVPEAEITAFTGERRDIPSVYEEAVSEADRIADSRFDNAQSTAEIVTISGHIDDRKKELERLREEERSLTAESGALDEAWKKIWEGAPFEPLPPESMLVWLDDRNEITRLTEEREAAERRLEALRKKEAETKALILGELSRLGVDTGTLEGKPLGVVIEAATDVLANLREDAIKRKGLENRLREMKAEAERKQRDLKSAEGEKTHWEAKWKEAVRALGLTESAGAAEAASRLDAIGEMREKAVKINELRHQRIEKIKRDIENLAQDVKKFVDTAAKDLAGEKDTENAVIELECRLTEAKRTDERRKEKEKDIALLERKIKEAGDSTAAAHETINFLQKSARVDDTVRLREAILKSDRLRELENEKRSLTDRLVRDGDGLTLEELVKECREADIASVRNLIEELEERRNSLDENIKEAAGELSRRKDEFEAVGGDDRAAEAAARKESAIAEMAHITERYVRIRSAATMLEWAIERYRKENQDPMINRASGHFAALTNGSFGGLDTEIDERDRVQIIGLRPGGERVGIPGMSDGTADQLYLALRIAAIEDYLERSNALPFVADDLFINFDDMRSAAGLKLLGGLSRKTQVLFFTHHAHLVELARQTLGESLNIVSLRE